MHLIGIVKVERFTLWVREISSTVFGRLYIRRSVHIYYYGYPARTPKKTIEIRKRQQKIDNFTAVYKTGFRIYHRDLSSHYNIGFITE